jgi:hypothetical protein
MSDFGKSKSVELQMTSSWIFQYRKKGGFVEIWKIPTAESEIFLVLGSPENFKYFVAFCEQFLEFYKKIKLFNYFLFC